MKIRYCLTVWAFLFFGAILMLLSGSNKPKFISGLYTTLSLTILVGLGIHRRLRILRVIKSVSPQLESKINYVPLLKASGTNTKREADWLFGNESTGDNYLDYLKADMRRFIFLACLVLASIPAIDVISSMS